MVGRSGEDLSQSLTGRATQHINVSPCSDKKMTKSNKKNDIILRNILNIAKIKPRDKKTDGKTMANKKTEDPTDLKR